MAELAIEVLPRVHRLGTARVNWYLVEDGGRFTIVDAGLPRYWGQLEPALSSIGSTLDNVAAVVLTHAHSDHTGVTGHLDERGVPIHLHPGDHELMRTGREAEKREGSVRPYLLHLDVWRFFLHMTRNGALRPPRISDVASIADGDQLDLPGRPWVVHTPGHRTGHCALHFEGHDALFVGDLMCTWNPLSGRLGPQIMPSAFNLSSDQCFESLGRIESLDANAVLPGHGEPWTEGVGAAVARAREAGPS